MKISAKTDYACQALLELALHWPNQVPLRVNEIAERRHIPIKFLTHILINLKQLNLVRSTRGKNGGYVLTRQPQEVKLSSVMKHFEGQGYLAGQHGENRTGKQVMDLLWQEIDASVIKLMDQISFEDICNRARTKDKVPTFDI